LEKRSVSTVLLAGGLALVYFAAGWLGLRLAVVNPSATAIWPPTGIALAAFLLFGYRVWPGVWLGAFLVNVTTSGAVPASMVLAVGNTAEGLLGAYLVNRFAHGRLFYERTQDIFKFAVSAGLLSTVVSATVGATSLTVSGLARPADFGAIWLTWWLGDAAGALIVAPAIILWAAPGAWQIYRGRIAEAAALGVAQVLVGLFVFAGLVRLSSQNYPIAYLLLPVVVWAGFRFGQHGAATTTLILSGMAVWGTLEGYGPFARANPNASLLLLQGFMVTIAVTGLGLAALVAEAARLYQAEQAARRVAEIALNRTARLESVAAALSQLLSPGRAAEVVIEQAVPALGAAAGVITLCADDGRTLEIVAASGYPAGVLEGFQRFPIEAPLPIAEAARSRQPVWLESSAVWRERYPQALSAHSAAGTEAAAALPIVVDGRTLGALGLSFAQARAFAPEDQALIQALAQQCAQALERARLYAEAQEATAALEGRVRERTEQLRALTLRLESLREEERMHIAREVHDELGGALTAIKMDISRLKSALEKTQPELREKLNSLLELVDASVQTVRRIATELRPALLDDFGLVAAIEWQLQEFGRRTGIECVAQLALEPAALDPAAATAIFRVLQEALTNVARHAQASQVHVSLREEGGNVILLVADNGRGFDREAAHRTPSLGLMGMRERAFAIGGGLEIESQVGQGSTVRVTIPTRATGRALAGGTNGQA
jgi:signal transduction histidine kinase